MRESGHFKRSSVSIIPVDLPPDTTMEQCFLLSGVYGEFGAKIMEIKVAEINAQIN